MAFQIINDFVIYFLVGGGGEPRRDEAQDEVVVQHVDARSAG